RKASRSCSLGRRKCPRSLLLFLLRGQIVRGSRDHLQWLLLQQFVRRRLLQLQLDCIELSIPFVLSAGSVTEGLSAWQAWASASTVVCQAIGVASALSRRLKQQQQRVD